MIYRSGREVKEIYLGNTPISAVWVGDKLIWRGRVYLESSAMLALTVDAWLTLARGLTYGAETEGAGLAAVGTLYGAADGALSAGLYAPQVYASPYLRYTSPMVTRPVGAGGYRADPEYADGEKWAGQPSVAGALYGAKPIRADGEKRSGQPSVAGALYGAKLIPADGEKLTGATVAQAFHRVKPICADGEKRSGRPTVAGASYRAKPMYADPEKWTEAGVAGTSYRVKPEYADPEKWAGAGVLWGQSAASGSAAPSVGSGGVGPAGCPSAVKAIVGDGIGGRSFSAALGGCSATMTLLYEGDIPEGDLDSMAVADMDGLGIENFDTRFIQQ